MKATIDRLMNRLRGRLGGRCALMFKLRDAGTHAIITFGIAHGSEGVWETHAFAVELAGCTPLEQARSAAEVFAAWEEFVLSVDDSALSEAHRWAE